MLDQPPVSLNPRSTIDANGQRINALMYRALTRIDANLNPQPDLASSWKFVNHGTLLEFQLKRGLKDAENQPITANQIASCLESYRIGKPTSPYLAAFPNWIGTKARDNAVLLRFSKPDPYVLRNISLLSYFRVKGKTKPCDEPPSGAELVSSGAYRMVPWNAHPETEIMLEPSGAQLRSIHITFVEDNSTAVLKLLRGDVDATLNTISIGATHWIKQTQKEKLDVIERDGSKIDYLAFNQKDPILKNLKVRLAIAHAIDRQAIVRNKYYGSARVAGSLLSPELLESSQLLLPSAFQYDPALAARLLDEAGFPLKNGKRFGLQYKTTPVREGFEKALMFKDMLSKIGIELTLDVVEPAVFHSSVKKGKVQIYSSRWLGVADGSILYRTLYSKSPDNRISYFNPRIDALLEKAVAEVDDARRIALMRQIQEIAARELPYFPLWYWNNGLIIKKGAPFFSKVRSDDLSLSGALEPTLILR
jgi:peptide/nickel transport system substrate-binding protein